MNRRDIAIMRAGVESKLTPAAPPWDPRLWSTLLYDEETGLFFHARNPVTLAEASAWLYDWRKRRVKTLLKGHDPNQRMSTYNQPVEDTNE